MLKLVLSMVLVTGLSSYFIPVMQKGPDKASMERGKQLYRSNCLACHQSDGNGLSGMYPPLAKAPRVVGDKKHLVDVIVNGLEEEIEVNGQVYNSPMAPLPHLKDQEIADILNYVRNSFGNSAAAVTPKEVKTFRKQVTKTP